MQSQVTVIVGCHNRLTQLMTSLPSWLRHSEIKEIVIIDWESDGANIGTVIQPWMLKHVAVITPVPKVRVIRIEDVGHRWILSLALNFAVFNAEIETPLVLKLDCDTCLHDNFFKQHALQEKNKEFWAGNWKEARNENETHLNGIVFASLTALKAIGGYNEHIRTYGWDDSDLYERLVKSGYTRRTLRYDVLEHAKHDDSMRSQPSELMLGSIKLEILKNMFVSKELPWSVSKPRTKYQWHPTRKCWTCVNISLNEPSQSCVDGSKMLALRAHLNDSGITWEMTQRKSHAFLLDLFQKEKGMTRMYIEVKNGLGNRLRALASAAVIAEATNQLLIVVWLVDVHCEGKYYELFDDSSLLVTSTIPPNTKPEFTVSTAAAVAIGSTTNTAVDVAGGTTSTVAGGAVGSLQGTASNIATHSGSESAIAVIRTKPTVTTMFAPPAVTLMPPRVSITTTTSGSSSSSSSKKIVDASKAAFILEDTTSVSNKTINCAEGYNTYIVSACVLNNPHTSWRKESNWLQQKLKIKEDVMKKIKQLESEFNYKQAIGIHIRMGQASTQYRYEDCSTWDVKARVSLEKGRELSHPRVFAYEMRRIWEEEQKPEQLFFICADNQAAYSYLLDKFPHKQKQMHWIHDRMYDRSTGQLQAALIDICLLRQCKTILGSPWSSFTELVARMGGAKVELAGRDFMPPMYGILYTPNSYNFGDDIQSIAAEQFLPRVDVWVNRDNQHLLVKPDSEEPYIPVTTARAPSAAVQNQRTSKIQIIENGWFDSRITGQIFNERYLDPLFVSFHINDSKHLFEDPNYYILKESAQLGKDMAADHVKQFQRCSPIGARDQHTIEILKQRHINAYLTSCLTLTLRPSVTKKTRTEILVVDAHFQETELYEKLVPLAIREKAIPLMHGVRDLLPTREKRRLAKQLLARYETAKLVITSRLHCAFPCLAYNTPVIFLLKNMSTDVRFDDTFRDLLGTDGRSLPLHWNWEKPTLSSVQVQKRNEYAKQLREQVTRFIFS